MRIHLLFLLFFIATHSSAQKKKPVPVLSFGLDYRMYPIDIEDVPRGPSPPDKGLPHDDSKFWKASSIHSRYGFILEKNWLLSASLYGRYNLHHRVQGVNYFSPYPTVLEPSPQKVKERKNLKFDFFIEVEKKIKLRKSKERYLFALAGIGFTNINSRFDIILTDSIESIPFDSHHYYGTLLHFSPRISLGYQYNKLKASLDVYIIEDPTLANLTSLWIGATISYEMPLKKNTVKTELYKKPDATVYYKQSITRKKIGLSLLAPTALLFLLGRMNLDINSPRYGNDRSGFSFAGVVTGGTSLYCLISSRHQLKKAERKNNNPAY